MFNDNEKKLRLKMKSRSQRYDINRSGPRYGKKYTKYKMCLNIVMVICITQYLSNVWKSVEKQPLCEVKC